MCGIFDFSDFAKKWGKKSDSSFKFQKKITKDFLGQNFSQGNPLQNEPMSKLKGILL